MGAFDGLTRRGKLTINHLKVTSPCTGFVLAVRPEMLPVEMIDAGANSAQLGGGDIRFALDFNGVTLLPLEVASFVPDAVEANRSCSMFVNMVGHEPSASVDTSIYFAWKGTFPRYQPIPDSPYGSIAVWQGGPNWLLVAHGADGPLRNRLTGLQLAYSHRAVEFGGNQYVITYDYPARKGIAAKRNVATGLVTQTKDIFTSIASDAHCTPCLDRTPDGHLCFVAGGYTGEDTLRFYKSTNPEDIATIDAPVMVDNTAGAQQSFCQLRVLDNSNMVVLFRGATGWERCRSTDGGATWPGADKQTLWSVPGYTFYPRTELVGGRLHMCWQVKTGAVHVNLYYAYTDNPVAASSAWKAIDGTAITTPMTSNATTVSGGRLFDITAAGVNSNYILGMCADTSNNVWIAAAIYNNAHTGSGAAAGNVLDEISVFRWVAGAWVKSTITTGSGLQCGPLENRNEGDIRRVSGTGATATLRCVLQRKIAGKWNLEEWQSSDGGATWTQLITIVPATNYRTAQYVKESLGGIDKIFYATTAAFNPDGAVEPYNSGHDVYGAGDHTYQDAAFLGKIVPISTVTVLDSGPAKADGTKSGTNTPTEVAGIRSGRGQNFVSGGYIDFGFLPCDDLQLYVECSVKFAASGANSTIAGQHGANYRCLLNRAADNTFAFYTDRAAGGHLVNTSQAGAMLAGETHHVVGQFDGTVMSQARDGVLSSTVAQDSPLYDGGSAHFYWAADSATLVGVSQDLWVADRQPTAGWRTTRFNNLSDPATFASGFTLTKDFPGALTFSGSTVRRAGKALSAALTFSGAVSTIKVALKALTAALTFAGSLARTLIPGGGGGGGTTTPIALTAGLTFAGSVGKRIPKALAAGLSFVGSIAELFIAYVAPTYVLTARLTQSGIPLIDVGDDIRIGVVFEKTDGTVVAPDVVRCKFRMPGDAAVTTLVYGVDAALARDPDGSYYVDLTGTIRGRCEYRFEGSGAKHAAAEGEFRIQPSGLD